MAVGKHRPPVKPPARRHRPPAKLPARRLYGELTTVALAQRWFEAGGRLLLSDRGIERVLVTPRLLLWSRENTSWGQLFDHIELLNVEYAAFAFYLVPDA